MRFRGRIAYKVLSLMIVCGILLIIYTTYKKREEDKFLTRLPDNVEQSDDRMRNLNLPHVEEKKSLLNLTNFSYRIRNDICYKQKHKDLLAVLIITSYAGHDSLRAAHRQAISQSKLAELGFQRVFLLASLPAREKFVTQKQLEDEQKRFGDLLQGDFLEAYRNLSYKHVMGLRWAATFCPNAKFIVKLDDDIVYDVFQLRRYLESLEVEHTKLASSAELLAGFIIESKPPIRNQANKWYVSESEYPNANYPSYLSGWMYITNGPTALRLVKQAEKAKFFWIDDTWVTGVLRENLKIPLQSLNAWYSANSEFLECCVRDLKQSSFECEYFVGPNGGDNKLLIEFLHNVEKCYFDECVKRSPDKSLKQTCIASAKHMLPAHGEGIIKPVKLR